MSDKIILALDPGMIKMGVSVMKENKSLIDHGLIREFHKDHPKAMNARLNMQMSYLCDELAWFLDTYEVNHVVWEQIPGKAMSSTTMVNGCLSVLKVLTFQRKLPYHEYSAQTWHNSLFQNTRIEKSEVKAWVLEKYPQINSKLSFDVFDAVAINFLSTEETVWSLP